MPRDKNLIITDHPFIIDSLSHLRDKNCGLPKFRRHSDLLCRLLFAEAIRGLDGKDIEIETPLNVKIKVKKLKDEIILVAILRAGLAMMFGALELLPKSKVGLVGLERDEKTAIARQYYYKIPPINNNSVVIITDPMLATGGSILHVLRIIAKKKPKEIRIACVIAAPEGLKLIRKEFKKVKIFAAALDSHLNSVKYIVPGIGDYGDRYFGTTT